MFINNKYLTIFTGEPCGEYPPKLYVDFFRLKPNLKRTWRDCNTVQARLGLFSFHLCVMIEWGWIERERNEHEEHIYKATQSFIKDINK